MGTSASGDGPSSFTPRQFCAPLGSSIGTTAGICRPSLLRLKIRGTLELSRSDGDSPSDLAFGTAPLSRFGWFAVPPLNLGGQARTCIFIY